MDAGIFDIHFHSFGDHLFVPVSLLVKCIFKWSEKQANGDPLARWSWKTSLEGIIDLKFFDN
jgi:hypothetical protein